MGNKKQSKKKEFWDDSAVRTFPRPEWEVKACSEADIPVIVLKPKAWAALSQCMFMAGTLEFSAYGVTRKHEDKGLYEVEDIVIPEQEATSGFVQPLFPSKEHTALQVKDKNVGLFTHIHSHHDMNRSFSAYDKDGPLRNNLAAVVLNHKLHPRGFAVTNTKCGKKIRTDALVIIGGSLASSDRLTLAFQEHWRKPKELPKSKITKTWGGKDWRKGMQSGLTGAVVPSESYHNNPQALLCLDDRTKVTLTPQKSMNWIVALQAGKTHHYSLDSRGHWYHEHKAKCFKKIDSTLINQRLWRMLWLAAEEEGLSEEVIMACGEVYQGKEDSVEWV